MINLLDNILLINWHSAKGTQLELRLIGVVGYEIVITCLMELMRLVTSKLNNVFADFHCQEANAALSGYLDAERGIDSATKPPLCPF